MATFKYYLREYQSLKGKSQIYWTYNHQGHKLRRPTGLSIKTAHWDHKKQRISPSSPHFDDYNSILRKLRAEVDNICTEAIFNKQNPDVDYVADKLRLGRKRAQSFFEHFDDFMADHRNKLSAARIQRYSATKNHLLHFQKTSRHKLSLMHFGLRCFSDFENYLIEQAGLSHNTVVTHIKVVKCFLRYTFDLKLHENMDFMKFSAVEKLPPIFVLTPAELRQLTDLRLDSARLERVRDVFLFQVYTGQRYGDIKALRKEDIKGHYWHLMAQKTQEKNIVPLTSQARQILEKYNYALPQYSLQKMNAYLKELGRLAGIDEAVNKYKWTGNKKVDNYLPKHAVLTTHVARKTFTTLSLMKDLDVSLIKDITGHKSYAVFERYKKLSDKYKLDKLENAWS